MCPRVCDEWVSRPSFGTPPGVAAPGGTYSYEVRLSLTFNLCRIYPTKLVGQAEIEVTVAGARTNRAATVGVVEHGNSVVLVTIAPDGQLVDRRRVELTERGLPTHPHHHEGSWAVGRYLNTAGARTLSLADAVALVECVRAAAARGAHESLEALATAVSMQIATIAIRACPTLPPTIEGRIADNRAQTVADSVMYREALATAAEARGWSVHWYDRDRVFRDAAAALGREDVDAFLCAMGRTLGPPWQARHKLAAAAALAAAGRPGAQQAADTQANVDDPA
jgi:hypothetical protein